MPRGWTRRNAFLSPTASASVPLLRLPWTTPSFALVGEGERLLRLMGASGNPQEHPVGDPPLEARDDLLGTGGGLDEGAELDVPEVAALGKARGGHEPEAGSMPTPSWCKERWTAPGPGGKAPPA